MPHATPSPAETGDHPVPGDGPIVEALRRLDEVGLEELLVAAELLTRVDAKYLLDEALVPEVLARIPAGVRALDIDGARTFRYESYYFDTPELLTHRDAARDRPVRFKVRTRAYLDSNACSLEVKRRDRHGRTVKERVPYDIEDRTRLTDEGRRFVASFDGPRPHADALSATLLTAYRRSTLLLSADNRATIDTGLRFGAPDGAGWHGGRWAVIETKSMGKPTVVDRALWSLGQRPVTLSKYSVGLAGLHPHLPANRWSRVLRQRFGLPPAATTPGGGTPTGHERPPEAAWRDATGA